MNFGLQGGKVLEEAALANNTATKWQGIPVLIVVLFGGFIVNAIWCLWQNRKNNTFADYRTGGSGIIAGNIFFAGIAGVIWAMQFVCQKVGEPALGDLAYISFAIVMGAAIFFSTLVGILLGEWKGVGQKTKALLSLGIAILLVSFCVMSYGNKLKGQEKAPAAAPAAAEVK